MKFIDFQTGEYNAEIEIDCVEDLIKIFDNEMNSSESNDEFINRLFIERLNQCADESNKNFSDLISKITGLINSGNYTNLEMMRFIKRIDMLSIKSTKTFINLLKFLMRD